jgi:coenzyme F420 hydrogenase subunit beta
MTDQLRVPTPAARFNRISECGLCIGCGICQGIAGGDRIRIKVTQDGYQRPVIVGELDRQTVDQIYDVCPGTRVEGLPESLHDEHTRTDKVWGRYQRIVLSYASDPEVRFRGSTGGVLTALAMYLIDSAKVEFILHVKASVTHPMSGEKQLSFSPTDVFEAAGSRYGPAAPLLDIKSVLDLDKPFAFIGKPCDIGALRNLARHDSRVDELVKYWLTPVCGGYSPPPATVRFLHSIGIDESQVKSFSYRGYGCPGPTRVETHDGRIVEKNYLDLWGEDETQWSLPFRCKVCPAGIGDSADIAAADTWPGGSPEREGQEKDPGTNAIIARTRAGADLLVEAERAGFLTTERHIGTEELSLWQPHQVNKKYAAWARHQGLKTAGELAPETFRLRIETLAKEMDEEFIRLQSEGTSRRVREGKTREPTPR